MIRISLQSDPLRVPVVQASAFWTVSDLFFATHGEILLLSNDSNSRINGNTSLD